MCKLVTIDIGNSVFKVSHDSTRIEFNSKIKKIDINTMDLTEAIVFNEECYAIAQGDYVHNNFKADKEGLEQFILYAISIIDDDLSDVSLMLNLPVNQLANKELLKSRLLGNYQYTVNSPLHGLNKKSKNLTISKIGVVSESVAAYYSLGDELSDFTMILDIGSKTINYATFTEIGVNDIAKSDTLDFGIHDLYKDVIDYFKTEHHKTYSIGDIDSRVKANKIQIPNEIKINFIEKLKNNLRAKGFMDFEDYSIKACGGGAIVLKNDLVKNFSDIEILDNALFRNNIGSQLIAESTGF